MINYSIYLEYLITIIIYFNILWNINFFIIFKYFYLIEIESLKNYKNIFIKTTFY